jgi:3'-5' exoribonuclease
VTAYQNEVRLTVDELKKVPEDKIHLEDFLPASPLSIDSMRKDFFHYLELVVDPFLKQLLEGIFKEKQLWEAFSLCPSSRRFHQAYLSGLLEHTNNVVRNSLAIAQNYPDCNRDLLITGALLHDFGKIYEYEFRRSITYTDQGRLLGHLILGLLFIDRQIQQIPEFPEPWKVLLFHLLISHHGTREWGSPRRPKTREAIILFFADYLDSRLSAVQEADEEAKRTGEKWQWSCSFEHYLFCDFEDKLARKQPDKGHTDEK